MQKETDMKKIETISKIKKVIKKNIYNLLYAFIISLFIVTICSFSDRSFFFRDDAQNEFLPYFRAIGRIWLKGEIPFIVKDTFIGQNQMIDFHRAIFLPQNIFFSILSVKISSFIKISRIIAFVNIGIMAFFVQKIGELFSLSNKFRLIMAFLFCINPIFLYFYLPSWWMGIGGMVWFVASFYTILALRKDFSIKNLILNVISVLFLLSAGLPHSVLAYIFISIFFIIESVCYKEYKNIVIFVLISLGIILIGINIYSEYIFSSYMLNRETGFGNFGNFLTPSFNQIFMTFTPVYYNFINRFGGYFMTYIPLGYSSIYILFLICFKKDFFTLFKNKDIKFIFSLLILFFVLSQAPSQINQMRFSFRFLPYFSEMLIIFSVFGISISELEFSKKRIRVFYSILLLSCLLSFFSLERNHLRILSVNILFVFITIIYLYAVRKNSFKTNMSIVYTIFMLLFMLFVQRSSGDILLFPGVKKEIGMENNFSKGEGGYLLSLTNGREQKENIEDLYSAEFLLYGIKAVNGYSPVGNKKLSELLEATLAHHFFNAEVTVNKLSKKYKEACFFDLMNIDSIALYKVNLSENMKLEIENCGFLKKDVKNQDIIYFVKKRSITGNVSYVEEGIKINRLLENKNNTEKYLISSQNKNSNIILSKTYWPGYEAYVNNKRLETSDEKGLLKVKIPSEVDNGILEIRYFPKTWKYTLWMAIVGIIIIFLSLFFLKKDKRI